MKKKNREISFRRQMHQSMADLQSIMNRGQSPSGDGQFTVRTTEVIGPSRYNAKAIRHTRETLNVSQAIFAELLGVSAALVRAWELGTRMPSPLARRLLDQVAGDPVRFALLVQPISNQTEPKSFPAARKRRVA